MDTTVSRILPSEGLFKLMLLLYDEGKVTFDSQSVLKDEQYFRSSMEILHRWKNKVAIEDNFNPISKKNLRVYSITLEGRMWVEQNIFEYRNCLRC